MAGYRGGGGLVSRPMDGGDPRTPMAWQHRDLALEQQQGGGSTPGVSRGARNGGYPSPARGGEVGRGTPGSRRARGEPSERGASSERAVSRERGGYSRSRSRERGAHERGGNSGGPGGQRGYHRSQPSPSTTEGTTEDTTETDSHTVEREGSEYQNGQMMPGYPVMVGYPVPYTGYPGMMPGTGSLRSVQSVPMLHPVMPVGAPVGPPNSHTWDGEPCPVHHGHSGGPMVPLAALYGMNHHHAASLHGYPPSMSMVYSVPPSVISGATTVRRARSVAELSQGPPMSQGPPTPADTMETDRRSLHASQHSLGHQSMPGGRGMGGQRMVVTENGAHSRLPVRSEQKKTSPLPAKEERKGLGCCSGHFVVIWIILGIVTFGVLLGIVLKFTVS